MRLRGLCMCALLTTAAVTTHAQACSPVMGYHAPTSLELAAEADVIVLATLTGERSRAHGEISVIARPTLLLKGTALPASVLLEGSRIATDPAMRPYVRPSAPRDLRALNPNVLAGGCWRRLFGPGMQVVLFLRRDRAGSFSLLRHAFSRDAEDVSGPGALWVEAVREYATIAVAPRAFWPARLTARAAALRAGGGADAMLIAADMDRERRSRR